MKGITDWFGSDEGELEKTLKQTNRSIESYNQTSDQVDRLLQILDESEPALASRLRSEREESQSWFNRYVVPAYEEVRSFFGSEESMGIAPLVLGVGATAISGAAVYGLTILKDYLDRAEEKEQLILNDPEIPKSVKVRLITGDSSAMTYAVAGGSVALLLATYFIFRKGTR